MIRFLSSFLYYLIAIPVGVVLVALAVANRQFVSLYLDPFARSASSFKLELPLFLLVFGALFIGILLGGLAVWIAQGKWRKKAREEARAKRVMERELSGKPQQAALPTPPHAF